MNQVKSNFQVVVASIATVYFGLFAFGAFLCIRKFEEVFNLFETVLPIQTTILIGTYRYWGVLGLVSAFILYKMSKSQSGHSMKLLGWLFAFSLVLVLFTIWGVYSPIFQSNGQATT